MAELSVWDTIRGTHKPGEEDFSVERTVLFGLFRTTHRAWHSYGQSPNGPGHFNMDVQERTNAGLVAFVSGKYASMVVQLSKQEFTFDGHDYGALNKTYLAELAEGQLVSVVGNVYDKGFVATGIEEDPVDIVVEPSAIPEADVEQSFRATLGEVQFY